MISTSLDSFRIAGNREGQSHTTTTTTTTSSHRWRGGEEEEEGRHGSKGERTSGTKSSKEREI